MKPKKRQKLCHNCEGEIDLDVIVCPFCAADLREEKPERSYSAFVATSDVLSQKETVQSLYPHMNLEEEDVEESSENLQTEESPSEASAIVPTVLFTLGVQLCVLGILMALFSHRGMIVLKWDARFWFFYLLGSVPLLVLGYRSLSRL